MPKLTFCDDADLLRAYRKAKVDVYYERDQDLAHEFCEFEEDLPAKLRALRRRIQLRDWTRDRKVVGTVRYAPKSICYELFWHRKNGRFGIVGFS